MSVAGKSDLFKHCIIFLEILETNINLNNSLVEANGEESTEKRLTYVLFMLNLIILR